MSQTDICPVKHPHLHKVRSQHDWAFHQHNPEMVNKIWGSVKAVHATEEIRNSHKMLAHAQSGTSGMSFSPWNSHGGKYQPQSKVIPNPKDWADEAMLVPHEGLTWLLKQFRASLAKLVSQPGQPEWKAKNLFLFQRDFLIPMVVHHHHVEEYIYFPILRKRVELPESFTTEHADLVTMLEELLQNEFHTGTLEEKLTINLNGVDALMKLWIQHLENEERIVPGILREHFTCLEESIVEKVIGASLGQRGMAMLMPLILHAMGNVWGGPMKAKEFIHGNAPLPVRWVYSHLWRPAFEHVILGLVNSVNDDVDRFPKGVSGYPYGPVGTWKKSLPVGVTNFRMHLEADARLILMLFPCTSHVGYGGENKTEDEECQ